MAAAPSFEAFAAFAAKNATPRPNAGRKGRRFYAVGWWRDTQPLPCPKGTIYYGFWHEVKDKIKNNGCNARFKGFDSIRQAAQHEDFKHMVPFEATPDIRSMNGGAEFTTGIGCAPCGARKKTFQQKKKKKRKQRPPSSSSSSSSSDSSDSSDSSRTKRRAEKKRRAKKKARLHAAPAFVVDVGPAKWDIGNLRVPLSHTDFPKTTTLFIATDGSVLSDNGAPGACGGMGMGWQWGEDTATRGGCWEALPWNDRGRFLIPPHTNISAEWRAVIMALSKLLVKTRNPDVRNRIHLHLFIDCKAVLEWMQKRLPGASKTPVMVESTQTNWVLKSQAFGLLVNQVVAEFASVELHWVKAHRSVATIEALTGVDRLAAELNARADAESKAGATAFTDAFLVPRVITVGKGEME